MVEEAKKGDVKEPDKEPDMIEKAASAAARLEAANKVSEDLLKRHEAIEARRILGGQSDAGNSTPKSESADEKWAREAKIRYKGTGMDPT